MSGWQRGVTLQLGVLGVVYTFAARSCLSALRELVGQTHTELGQAPYGPTLKAARAVGRAMNGAPSPAHVLWEHHQGKVVVLV